MKTTTANRLKVALFGGLLAITLPVSAATDKSGIVEDETWTLAMSPIRVIGDISVYSLTIQPGVEVLFTGNYRFDCPGVLTARGNQVNKIWFHGDTGVTWKGIDFLNSAPGSVLDYCIVQNSNDSGIEITNSSLDIANCQIQNNSATDNGGGINCSSTGQLVLTNCMIAQNSLSGGGASATRQGAGVYASGSLSMENCTVSGNSITVSVSSGDAYGTARGGGIYVAGSLDLVNCSVLTNSVVASAYTGLNATVSSIAEGGGIFAQSMKARNCIITGNSAQAHSYVNGSTPQAYRMTTRSRGGGMFTQDGLKLRNSIVSSNTISGANSGYGWNYTELSIMGGGQHIAGIGGNIANCMIASNSGGAAIYLSSGAIAIDNCTIVSNVGEGIGNSGGTCIVRNSILYFNNSGGTQVSGTATITYSDVQGGYSGTGNINQSPLFRADGTVPDPWPWPTPVPTSWPWPSRLSGSSPCKDAGNPDPIYNDLCFYDAATTPWGSLGAARNEMGAYGGPGAALWEPGSTPLNLLPPTGGGLVGVGDNVTLTAQASGIGPFTYVWKKGGVVVTDVPGHISGANTATLVITGATAADAGEYTVDVTNALGDMMPSPVAAVAVDPLRANVKMFAGIILQAAPGKTVRIEYSNDLSSGSWTTLTQLVLPSSPYTYYDADSPNHPKRFYRAIEVP